MCHIKLKVLDLSTVDPSQQDDMKVETVQPSNVSTK